jgi:serine/threonine-protein kinase HipA
VVQRGVCVCRQAYDALPSGQALGYQQLRVGRDGGDATLANAMSEHRVFALAVARVKQVRQEVAVVVNGWQPRFAACGVGARDLALLAEQIDRAFLREQRVAGVA